MVIDYYNVSKTYIYCQKMILKILIVMDKCKVLNGYCITSKIDCLTYFWIVIF